MAQSEIEADLVDPVSAGRWEWSPPPRPVHSALSQWCVVMKPRKAWRLHFVLIFTHRFGILYGEIAAEDM